MGREAPQPSKHFPAIGVEQLQQAYGGAKLMVMKDMALALAEAIKTSPNSFVPKTMVNMGGNGGASGASHPILEIFSMMGMKNLGLLDDLTEATTNGKGPEQSALAKELREDAQKALSES